MVGLGRLAGLQHRQPSLLGHKANIGIVQRLVRALEEGIDQAVGEAQAQVACQDEQEKPMVFQSFTHCGLVDWEIGRLGGW